MPNDEISDVRRIRHEITEECGHDIRRIAAYYRRVEEELKKSGEFRFEDQPSGRRATAPSSDVAITK